MKSISENRISELFNDSRVQSFIEAALRLSSERANPYLNYFGFNYTPEKITSVKFYVAFFHRLKEEEIKLLLPEPSDLLQYYDQWNESEKITADHTGCSFALKVSSDSSITNYFHLRMKGNGLFAPYFGVPNHIRLSWSELQQYGGVSHEYRNGESVKRLYFYLTDRITMSNAIKKCGDQFFLETDTLPNFIEYTETEKYCKLINGISDKNQLEAYLKFYSPNPMLSDITDFASRNGLMCVSPGKYEGAEVRSIYLIEANEQVYKRSSASLSRMYGEYKLS